MVYKNKRTGAVVTTDCVCRGEDWQEVKPAASRAAPKTSGRKRAVKKDE